MTKHLTLAQKRQYLLLLIERDGGYMCFYCKQELTNNTVVYEHLNGNRWDNRLDNIVLACQSCNIKKVTDGALEAMSWDKLDENENRMFVGERFLKKNLLGKSETTEASKEIEISMKNSAIVQDYISEVIESDGSIEYKDALNSGVYLCKSKTGHGSQQSVRNYIASITSIVAPFEIIREGKKKVIVKRMNRIDLPRNEARSNSS